MLCDDVIQLLRMRTKLDCEDMFKILGMESGMSATQANQLFGKGCRAPVQQEKVRNKLDSTIRSFLKEHWDILNIQGPVSEILRKLLLEVHHRIECSPFQPLEIDIGTLYYLTPPSKRPQFFQRRITHSHLWQKRNYNNFVHLLKPGDNLAFFLLWEKQTQWMEHAGSIVLEECAETELRRLLPEHSTIGPPPSVLPIPWTASSLLLNLRMPGARRGLIQVVNSAWQNANVPTFSMNAGTIIIEEWVCWHRRYFALTLDCTAPVWEAVYWSLQHHLDSR